MANNNPFLNLIGAPGSGTSGFTQGNFPSNPRGKMPPLPPAKSAALKALVRALASKPHTDKNFLP